MNKAMETKIKKTGIDGLDETLGGGIPEGHVVLLTGRPGTGKTVLSFQWLFEGWKKLEHPGIYIAVTEPFTKAIKNIASMDFYDRDPLESGNLSFTDLRSMMGLMDFEMEDGEWDRENINGLVNRIEELVEESDARRLVIDSITAVGYMIDNTELFRYFIFRLGTVLEGKNCTVFLTSETRNGSTPFNVEDFISDGIINLDYTQGEETMLRKMEVSKMRGVDFQSGSVFFDISSEGITVFPKSLIEKRVAKSDFEKRKNTGIDKLDKMLQGGYPEGHIVLITGNTGTGKTSFCMEFLNQGLQNGESCIFINLEEPVPQVRETANVHGWNFDKHEKEGMLRFVSPKLIDTHPDRFLNKVLKTVKEANAKRVVLDSVTSIPSAGLSEDKTRQILLKLTSALKARDVTALMTHLQKGLFSQNPETILGTTQASDLRLSSICDGIIMLRHVEWEDRVARAMNILKMRGCEHDMHIRELEITDEGIKIGDTFREAKNDQ